MTRRRQSIPFDEWSSGRSGHILFCVQCFRLATRQARAGKAGWVRGVYKMEFWAERHAEDYGHLMREVEYARELAARL